jgi:hypothetical protein
LIEGYTSVSDLPEPQVKQVATIKISPGGHEVAALKVGIMSNKRITEMPTKLVSFNLVNFFRFIFSSILFII